MLHDLLDHHIYFTIIYIKFQVKYIENIKLIAIVLLKYNREYAI